MNLLSVRAFVLAVITLGLGLPVAHSKEHSLAYPKEVRGEWMPAEIGCIAPINYDSESLILIDSHLLGQYENTSKPIRVAQVSVSPRAWKIVSMTSPGTGEYSGNYSEIFMLSGNRLIIAHKNGFNAYVKCSKEKSDGTR